MALVKMRFSAANPDNDGTLDAIETPLAGGPQSAAW
jgi:hypothetical protein